MFLRSRDPDSSTSRYEVLADIKLELELCHNNPAAAGRGDTESCAGHRTARRHTTGAVTTRAQGAGGHGGADIFWCSDIFSPHLAPAGDNLVLAGGGGSHWHWSHDVTELTAGYQLPSRVGPGDSGLTVTAAVLRPLLSTARSSEH